jgi:hypothetical protein
MGVPNPIQITQIIGNYAAGYESWGLKKEKGWNGLE